MNGSDEASFGSTSDDGPSEYTEPDEYTSTVFGGLAPETHHLTFDRPPVVLDERFRREE